MGRHILLGTAFLVYLLTVPVEGFLPGLFGGSTRRSHSGRSRFSHLMGRGHRFASRNPRGIAPIAKRGFGFRAVPAVFKPSRHSSNIHHVRFARTVPRQPQLPGRRNFPLGPGSMMKTKPKNNKCTFGDKLLEGLLQFGEGYNRGQLPGYYPGTRVWENRRH